MLFLFISTITNDMDFGWALWIGKPHKKSIPQSKKSSVSRYSTYFINSLGNVFQKISLLAFLQHRDHLQISVLTDTGGGGCHFRVLLRWLSSHRPPCILWRVPVTAVCRNHLPSASWVWPSQRAKISYSADSCVCSFTTSFKTAAIGSQNFFVCFVPYTIVDSLILIIS